MQESQEKMTILSQIEIMREKNSNLRFPKELKRGRRACVRIRSRPMHPDGVSLLVKIAIEAIHSAVFKVNKIQQK